MLSGFLAAAVFSALFGIFLSAKREIEMLARLRGLASCDAEAGRIFFGAGYKFYRGFPRFAGFTV
jgi:hypothetical protein